MSEGLEELQEIAVWRDGVCVGYTKTANNFEEGSVMELIDGTLGDERINILHLRTMNYGIVIPADIANEMYKALE